MNFEQVHDKILFVPIVDTTLQLSVDRDDYYLLFKKNYYSTSFIKTPTFKIDIKKTDFYSFILKKNTENSGVLFYPKKAQFYIVNGVLMAFIEHFTFFKNIFFLHASSFIKNDKAYLFCGPSGTGKTTIIKAINQKQVLSDDIAVLKKIGKNFFIFPSPFDNVKHKNYHFKGYHIHKIFFLKQSDKTKFVRLDFPDALSQIISNNLFGIYILEKAKKIMKKKDKSLLSPKTAITNERNLAKKLIKFLYRMAINLSLSTSLYKLYFTKDLRFLSQIEINES